MGVSSAFFLSFISLGYMVTATTAYNFSAPSMMSEESADFNFSAPSLASSPALNLSDHYATHYNISDYNEFRNDYYLSYPVATNTLPIPSPSASPSPPPLRLKSLRHVAKDL